MCTIPLYLGDEIAVSHVRGIIKEAGEGKYFVNIVGYVGCNDVNTDWPQ